MVGVTRPTMAPTQGAFPATPRAVARTLVTALAAVLVAHVFMRLEDHWKPSAPSAASHMSTGITGGGADRLDPSGGSDVADVMITCLALAASFGVVRRALTGSSSRLEHALVVRAPRGSLFTAAGRHPPWRRSSLVARSVLLLS